LSAGGLQPANTTTPVTAATSNTQWLAIQKAFGPIYFERVGLEVDGPRITAVLDASFTVRALKIALQGLKVTSPLQPFSPEFSLDGLAIDFKTDGLEIGGAFLRQKLSPKPPGQTGDYVYGGLAVIRASKLTLSAIGSYSTVGGQPSLFIYAVLDYPIGGPSFFFVTGLAAAFGYNRALIMPDIDQVDNFPLIKRARSAAQATSTTTDTNAQTDLAKELVDLETYIPVSAGQYFLGVGIHFTSFKIVDSVLLLAVQFGQQVSIDLLGSSILTAPAGASESTLVAKAALNLKARYVPSEGTLTV
jgi:hypothetical protein